MTILSEKLSDKEMEIVIALVKSDCNAFKDNFSFMVEKFSEAMVKEKEAESLLTELTKKGYVEIESSSIILVEKGKSEIVDFVFHNWKETKTRWRRIFSKSAWIIEIATLEVKLVEKLLENKNLKVDEELLSELDIGEHELKIFSRSNMLELDKHNKNNYLIRSSWFIRKCAEIIHNEEAQGYHLAAKEWREKSTEFFDSIKDQKTRKLYDIRLQRELYKIKSVEVCPIGLPVKCFESFLHDEDSLFQTERHFSSDKFNCKITIKPSFYDGHTENFLFAEMIQEEGSRSEGIVLKGEISEVRDLLLKTKEEMEKIREANKSIKFEKEQSSFYFEIVYMGKSGIEVTIPSYMSTGTEIIASVSYNGIRAILNKM
ncbi:hypothetical protein KAK05_02655 [Candidatus Parcubacteria bacterium]|nr:hypothetical protein [Candidatus Parcubacteria bacterium]